MAHSVLVYFFVVAFMSLSAGTTSAMEKKDDELAMTKELRYREVFFNYYRKDLFSALTRISAEAERRRLPASQEVDLDLLKGSLYFSYGMPEQAEKLLLQLTKSTGKRRNRDMAWFYLARMYFQQGDAPQAEAALTNVSGDLPEVLQSEYDYLAVMIAVAKGRYDVAENKIDDMDSQGEWIHYARFNLGAALVKTGKREKGIDYIDAVGRLRGTTTELLALRDKANLTLGYYYLRANRSEDAINYFERVRVEGPFTNKALLGMGWAFAQDKIYDRALVPWVTLSQGSVNDVTVQESLLAASYAYSQSGGEKKALAAYNEAIEKYKHVQKTINDSIHDVQRGRVAGAILSGDEFDDFAISNRLRGITSRENGYLIVALLQDDDFQRLLRTYRDLRYLHTKVETWKAQLQSVENGMPVRLIESNATRGNIVQQPGNFDTNSREAIAQYKARIERSSKKLNEILDEYEKKLQDAMVEKLDDQYRYVTTYLSQAKLAIAQLFDAANKGGAPR
jgi:tetratricopeptide (TPR) repeat protein